MGRCTRRGTDHGRRAHRRGRADRARGARVVHSEGGDRMSVNMSKGQRISLEKQGGGELTKVRMGLGWDAMPKKGLFGRMKAGKDIDLDASCVVLDEARNEIGAVWFKKL